MVDGIGNVRGPLTAVKRTSNALKAFQRSERGSVTRFGTLLRRTTNLTWRNAKRHRARACEQSETYARTSSYCF